jgi:hypothetical protein
MNSNKLQIDLELLPKVLQEELFAYYEYLLSKHRLKKNKNYQQDDFFSTVNESKFNLPEDYNFNRDTANER